MYNTFHSFSDHEVSRNIAREEDEFYDQDSDSRSRSQSRSNSNLPARRMEQQATYYFMRNNGDRMQNPFAEAPLNIEVSMP